MHAGTRDRDIEIRIDKENEITLNTHNCKNFRLFFRMRISNFEKVKVSCKMNRDTSAKLSSSSRADIRLFLTSILDEFYFYTNISLTVDRRQKLIRTNFEDRETFYKKLWIDFSVKSIVLKIQTKESRRRGYLTWILALMQISHLRLLLAKKWSEPILKIEKLSVKKVWTVFLVELTVWSLYAFEVYTYRIAPAVAPPVYS